MSEQTSDPFSGGKAHFATKAANLYLIELGKEVDKPSAAGLNQRLKQVRAVAQNPQAKDAALWIEIFESAAELAHQDADRHRRLRLKESTAESDAQQFTELADELRGREPKHVDDQVSMSDG